VTACRETIPKQKERASLKRNGRIRRRDAPAAEGRPEARSEVVAEAIALQNYFEARKVVGFI